ncbi:MAG: 30S ribosomal protein S16 [Bdellovibrionales bacterium]|nr:30S ribosomal protein S16 [Bdellovibrionales bacterium]
MVVIRLNRVGAKRAPKYRITVADQRRSKGGRFVEVLGSYNPNPSGAEKGLELDLTKVQAWVAKGAQPTLRVKSLIKKAQASQIKN